MKNILHILIIILIFTSCGTVKQFSKFHKKHPQQSADSCAKWYPIQTDSVKTIIKYKEGESVIIPGETQYVSINCDSIVAEEVNKKSNIPSHAIYIPVEGKLRVDTFYRTITNYVENAAYKVMLRDSILNEQKDNREINTKLNSVKKTRNKLWLAVIALTAIAGLQQYLKVKTSLKTIKR